MQDMDEMNAKIEDLGERVKEFDDAIKDDGVQLVFLVLSVDP